MDRVRFGRALGMGARAAARSAMEAVQAASAPDPRAPQGAATSAATAPRQPEGRTNPSVLPPLHVAQSVAQSVGPAVRSASTRVAGPIRQASRALWHEVTGSFFALFAVSFGAGVWHMRATALSPVQADRFRFYAFCFFALLFAYFSLSSFVRARRKE